jgi:hypothetical protein
MNISKLALGISLVAIMTAGMTPRASAITALGGGTNCKLVYSTSTTSATLCAAIYQGQSRSEHAYGKLLVNTNRSTVSSAVMYVDLCNSSSNGECKSIVSNYGRSKTDITAIWNKKACSTIIREGNVSSASLTCQEGLAGYSIIAGNWYVTRAFLYINGSMRGNYVLSPPQRAGS